MKHNFLRRLGALTLAFALALTLVPTAWAASPADSQTVKVGDKTYYLTLTTSNQTNDEGDLLLGFDETGRKGSAQLKAVLMEIPANLDEAHIPASGQSYKVAWTRTAGNAQTAVISYDPDKSYFCTVTAGDQQNNVTITATATLVDENGDTVKDENGSPLPPLTASFTVHVYEASMRLLNRETLENMTHLTKPVQMNVNQELEVQAEVMLGTEVGQGQIDWSYRALGNTDGKVKLDASSTGYTCKITAEQAGTVIVTAASREFGVSASFTVEIQGTGIPVRDITLSGLPSTMTVGDIKPITVTVTPSNATNRDVEWTCTKDNNKDIVKVEKVGNEYRVTALAVGTSTITFTSVSNPGVSKSVTVTVVTELTGLTINNTTSNDRLNLSGNFTKPGNTMTVSATRSPSDAVTTTSSISWSSSNTGVVTVATDGNYSNGLHAILTLVGPGEATLTVKSGDIEDTCTVIIPGVVIKSEILTMSGGKITMKVGETGPLSYDSYGTATSLGSSTVPNWTSSDSSIVDVDRITGVITARRPGTATITLEVGSGNTYYTATCQVTVVEDTSGLITLTGSYPSGAAINMGTAQGRCDIASGTLSTVLNALSRDKTGNAASYITNLSVSSTDQGILHDEHHSADDTGAGVGMQDKYYLNANTAQGQRPLSDLSFVPRNTFNGTAEITFTGWSTNNQPFNGTIRISVNGTGDVMYSSNDGSAVSFLASDFNYYHPNLKSVSFTPPQESVGTLYYNYTSPSQPGTKVISGTLYSRTGTPNIDKVTFVPASGYAGTVKISYKGTDTSGRSFTGTVTITVTKESGTSADPADISYSVKENDWLTFRPSDFNTASLRTLGETLSYVRFTPPPSSAGTLFYNYRGFSDFDSMVNNTTSYYYSGNPALSGVSFVPTTTTPAQVDIKYTGYTTRGNTFEGTIHIGLNDNAPEQQLLHYTVFTGKTVNLSAADFNTACMAATGTSLATVRFTSLPTVSQGNLRYTRGSSSTPYNVATSTTFYRTGTSTTANLIGNVYFQANANYTGTVTIPFTGVSDNGTTFTDAVVITVTPPTATDITYSGTTASSIRLAASRVQSANSGVLSNLSYITFTTLPSSTAGKLYVGYNGFGTGTQVNTGTRYYASGSPSIDQISFVPRGRYNGQVSVGYTAYSTSGQSVSGRMVFSISSTGNSNYFSDMYNHTWAAPSVDYLYQNGVTNGVTSTTYGPNQRILRGDFVLMLCRAFGFNGSNGYSFSDVPTSSYYSQAIATAKQLGIINGDGGRFMPNSAITRQDAMVIINNAMRAAGWNVGSAPSSVLSQFSDSGSVSGYAVSAVSALVQMGAVNGDNGRLLPHNSITRAEAAVILHFVMTM